MQCLLALTTSFAFAHDCASSVETELATSVLAKHNLGTPLFLSRRVNENEQNTEHPVFKGIIFTPEVTMKDNTLYFITPCDGYEFRLVRNNIICYSTEIDSDTLTIPNTIHGTYELQIVVGDYIFYTKVTLP